MLVVFHNGIRADYWIMDSSKKMGCMSKVTLGIVMACLLVIQIEIQAVCIQLMSVFLSFFCFSVCLCKVSVCLWFSIMVSERIIG